jgi:hypothetical protein
VVGLGFAFLGNMTNLEKEAERYSGAAENLAKREEWPLHRILERTFLSGARTGAHRTMSIFIECCGGKISSEILQEIMEKLSKEDLL